MAIWEGKTTTPGIGDWGLTITMVINNLLYGMIHQVETDQPTQTNQFWAIYHKSLTGFKAILGGRGFPYFSPPNLG